MVNYDNLNIIYKNLIDKQHKNGFIYVNKKQDDKINAIFIQSFHKEIITDVLQNFLNNLTKLSIDIPIVLFLDLKSKQYIQKLDKYIQNISIEYVNDQEYNNNITTIFHKLINYKTLEYPKILLLESDCIVKPNFINILNSDIQGRDFWIYGSFYYGLLKHIEKHINGVAIYYRNNIFLKKIQNVFIKQNYINKKNVNYDCILSKNCNNKKLIDSKYILNICHKGDINLDFYKIKKQSVIIHQKSNLSIKYNRKEWKCFKQPIKIAHLINPFKCSEDNPSYLYYAQPITFKSMHNAQLEAQKVGIDVKLYAINYPEDDEIIPKYFIKLPYLKKSTMSEFPKIAHNRKLPIIQEMFDSILQNSDADYIIFTNSDIGVQKIFYKKINEFIHKDNLKSFIINRRDNIPKFKEGKRLTEKDLDYIYKESGQTHPGKDCFIMHREILEKINMNLMFTGYPPWGYTLHNCMKKIDKKTHLYTNKYLTFHLGCDRSWQKKGKSELWSKNIEISKKIFFIVYDFT